MATATWDTFYKGAAVTLSGSNLIATVSSDTGSVRTNLRLSGKTYFEVVLGATLSGSSRVGMVGSGYRFDTTLLGSSTDNTGIGYDKGGTVVLNNATVATIATYTTSSNIGVAIDTFNQKIWFRVDAGNWNNDVIGNQNPALNVGGISIAAISGTMSPAWGGSATSSTTLQANSASWTNTAPSGFSSIETYAATNSTLTYLKNQTVYTVPAATIKIIYGSFNSTSNLNPIPIAAVLPPGINGSVYSETISASGGTSPYTFAVTSGSLPTGLSLNTSSGVISGTPTVSAVTSTFTITATDSVGASGATSFNITVNDPVSGASNYGFAA